MGLTNTQNTALAASEAKETFEFTWKPSFITDGVPSEDGAFNVKAQFMAGGGRASPREYELWFFKGESEPIENFTLLSSTLTGEFITNREGKWDVEQLSVDVSYYCNYDEETSSSSGLLWTSIAYIPHQTAYPLMLAYDVSYFLRLDFDVSGNTYTVLLWFHDFGQWNSEGFRNQAGWPPDPQREGYTFDGWFVDPELTIPLDVGHIMTGDYSLYAKFTVITYTITYNLNGGTLNFPINSYNIETMFIIFMSPSRSGYAFMGWYEDAAFTDNKTTSIILGRTGDIELFAKWEAIAYTVTYNLGGGALNNPVDTYTVESPTITLQTPTRTGYTFLGWFINAAFTGAVVTQIAAGSTGNKVFFVKWETIQYTITYFLNGGTQSGHPTGFNVESGNIPLSIPTKTGYSFGGWFAGAAFTGAAITEIAAGTANHVTLYAKWETLRYTVTFYVDGAVYREITVDYGTKIADLMLIDMETVSGVSLYADGDMTKSFDRASAIIQDTHIFASSGFDVFVSLTTVVQDKETTILVERDSLLLDLLVTPALEGYTFGGWYYDAEFTEEIEPADKIAANTTVYAKMTKDVGGLFSRPAGWLILVGGILGAGAAAFILVKCIRFLFGKDSKPKRSKGGYNL